jgi:preprotein translocase subunit YajC
VPAGAGGCAGGGLPDWTQTLDNYEVCATWKSDLHRLKNVEPTPIRKTGAPMDSLILFLPFLLIMGGFMYVASRKQKRAMQATIDLHESLQPGDRVHTTSGLEATITAIADDTVDLEIAPGVVTTWMKLAIRDRITPDIDEDDEDIDEDADDELDDSDLDGLDGSAHENRATKDF